MPSRDATLKDALFIAELDEELLSNYNGPHALSALKMMAYPDTVSLIYTDEENSPAGFAIIQWKKDHSYITQIAVKPSHQNRGIGPVLLEECERRVFELGGPHMLELHVAEDNARARKVFETFGFEYTGVAPVLFKNGVKPLRMLKFAKALLQSKA